MSPQRGITPVLWVGDSVVPPGFNTRGVPALDSLDLPALCTCLAPVFQIPLRVVGVSSIVTDTAEHKSHLPSRTAAAGITRCDRGLRQRYVDGSPSENLLVGNDDRLVSDLILSGVCDLYHGSVFVNRCVS